MLAIEHRLRVDFTLELGNHRLLRTSKTNAPNTDFETELKFLKLIFNSKGTKEKITILVFDGHDFCRAADFAECGLDVLQRFVRRKMRNSQLRTPSQKVK